MEEALISYLLSSTTITSAAGQRVTPGWRTQGAPMPAVTINVISRQPAYTMGGASGLDNFRVQIDVWAETYSAAKALARAVVARLGGANPTVGSVRFDGIFLQGERDIPEPAAPQPAHRVSLDFNLWAAVAS